MKTVYMGSVQCPKCAYYYGSTFAETEEQQKDAETNATLGNVECPRCHIKFIVKWDAMDTGG